MRLDEFIEKLESVRNKIGGEYEVRMGRELSENTLTCSINSILACDYVINDKTEKGIFLINDIDQRDDFFIPNLQVENETNDKLN